MPDFPGWLEILTEAFETRFGGWQQPDMMDPCRAGLGGCRVQWTSGYELRKVTTLFSRLDGGGLAQDAAMVTMHFLNLTAGAPDATWIAADYAAVEARLDTWWTALKAKYASQITLTGYRWSADGPGFKPHGSSLSPTLRNTARSVAGSTANQSLPPQVAVTVTETTDAKFTVLNVEGVGTQLRNRWGRFYLPPPDILQDSAGRPVAAFTALAASATQTLYNGAVADGFVPVVYSPTTGSAWSVKEVHCDDIFDVIRSRRFTGATARNALAITQP